MATLEYLDEDGRISYQSVSWKKLNCRLSYFNSAGAIGDEPPTKGANRGKIIEELEERRKGSDGFVESVLIRGLSRIDRGYGLDWRNYENGDCYTHFEEVLVYQPKEWRNQAREYLYQYCFDVNRKSENRSRVTDWVCRLEHKVIRVTILMPFPILVVLMHPAMKRSTRYEPVNFLLAYGAKDPFPCLGRFFVRHDNDIPMSIVAPGLLL